MIGLEKFDSLNGGTNINYNNILALNTANQNIDNSIFDTAYNQNGEYSNESGVDYNIEMLNAQLADIEADNGAILDSWNKFKGTVGIGTSSEKCEEAIEKYKNSEITFEEASKIIQNFENKQDNSLNLFSNITTGVVAIAAVTAVTALTGGAALPFIAAIGVGAAAGAVAKSGFKTVDRATNEVEGDALDGKQIAKDALSGAVTGGIAAATAGTGESVFNAAGEGAGLSTHIANGAISSAKTGLKTGAVSGASNYLIDCAFEDDKDLDASEFVQVTASNAIAGAVVGSIMGSATGALRHSHVLTASNSDVIANSASTASYKILGDKVRSIAA